VGSKGEAVRSEDASRKPYDLPVLFQALLRYSEAISEDLALLGINAKLHPS
jgi:hypothetical protein